MESSKEEKRDYSAIVTRYRNKNRGRGSGQGGIKESSGDSFSDMLNSRIHACPDDWQKEMNSLIGLDNIRQDIERIQARYGFYAESGLPDDEPLGHMCFYGPPGTGKTTVARIIGRILYETGFVKRAETLEIDGSFVRRVFSMGHGTLERMFAKASGGILFIDEAYTLSLDKSGYEIIALIIKIMEDYRDELVIIFAGYENEMLGMLSQNPGFRSRIKTEVWFDSFSLDELMEIFFLRLRTGTIPFNIERGAAERVKECFSEAMKKPDFANARFVRNACSKLIDIHAVSFYRSGDEDLRYVITVEDAEEYAREISAV